MSFIEVLKRLWENLLIYYSRIKYRYPAKWPYSRFAHHISCIVLHRLPGIPLFNDWKHFRVFNAEFDLTKPLDWYYSENRNTRWPDCHYAKINYRPGNPYGDVRINWELNRLQFFPAMAINNEKLAKTIIKDWMINNPFLHGPGYLSSMEVALRWFSIYWAVCLFKQPLDNHLERDLTGLAVASGKFIESRLSTHSAAGNHLIVEAVGLFWLGKALENDQLGARWISKAREILWRQIIRQINPDGTNQEQSFWYLGFVLDALFYYLLLEERAMIPSKVWERVEKMLELINELTFPDVSFPDYGDRDDGFVFLLNGIYEQSPFSGLLNIGSFFFNRPEWYRGSQLPRERLAFWTGKGVQDPMDGHGSHNYPVFPRKPVLNTYKDGGMTLMQWGKGRLLFRHAPLGLGPSFGHGHADALSVLFYWCTVPVIIDLGSGQYNGDQAIRNFFRSTIAHNTVEIGGKSQATILGPFMWKQSYEATLKESGKSPILHAEASHDGYMKEFSVLHTRRIGWPSYHQIEILDSFHGGGELPLKGALHLGDCRAVNRKGQIIEVDFGNFWFSLSFPSEFSLETYYGSELPFMGWRSTIYGKWEPIHSIVYTGTIQDNYQCKISFTISEKP